MNIEIYPINCKAYDASTNRADLFRVARYTFNYQSNKADKAYLDQFLDKGQQLAKQVNPGAANHAATKRSFDKILNNCVAGLIAEHLWERYLNRHSTIVRARTYERASSQIDLEVIANRKKIEVRSSFPRKGIDFALCSGKYEFDVIGPYANSYKPDEIQKDYYLRTLFHLQKIGERQTSDGRTIAIIENLTNKLRKDGFAVYLTGGVPWHRMVDDSTAKDKNLIPEDEMDINRVGTATYYRVVPFSKAYDTVEIYETISREK
jgi:hypothetical protein